MFAPHVPQGLDNGLTNYGDRDFARYLRRSMARSMGISNELLDKPVIGIATIQAMRIAGAVALSVDAGRTLVLDGHHVFKSANEAGIAIIGRPRQEQEHDGR